MNLRPRLAPGHRAACVTRATDSLFLQRNRLLDSSRRRARDTLKAPGLGCVSFQIILSPEGRWTYDSGLFHGRARRERRSMAYGEQYCSLESGGDWPERRIESRSRPSIADFLSNTEQLRDSQACILGISSLCPGLISVTESVVLPPDANLACARGGSEWEIQ